MKEFVYHRDFLILKGLLEIICEISGPPFCGRIPGLPIPLFNGEYLGFLFLIGSILVIYIFL